MINFVQFFSTLVSKLVNIRQSKKAVLRVYFAPLIIFSALLFTSIALASVAVTQATGGSAISADTTGGAYTTLTGPIITEGATGDIGVGTIILNAPSGFVFDTTGAPTVLVTRTAGSGSNTRNINDLASGSTIAVTVTSTTLSITITAATSNGVRNSLTWQNVRARPSAGTPLASGNILKTGTSAIVGVTNSVTNLGTLTEVVGAKNKLAITTQPSSAAVSGIDFATKPIVVLQDQFGNTVTTDSASTITRTAVLSTQACGGTLGGGTLTSTPPDSAVVSSGVMTYTAMNYTAVESIKICFASSGVTSALSNAIAVSPGTLDHFALSAISTQTAGTPFTVTITAQDANNNTVTSFTGTVDLSTTAGTITPTESSAFVSGIRTESVTVTQSGVGKTITATDHAGTGKTGTSSTFTVNNPVPTTTSISPTSKFSGESTFSLTVFGTNFTDSSVVNWNGSPKTTVFSSSTQLTATILASDIAASGTSSVTVSNPAPGGGTSTAQSFVVTDTATRFVILPLANTTVDSTPLVTIQAQKVNGDVDTSYQSDVTLVTSGGGTGGGLVDIVNGIGTATIGDHTAETVTLSLSDTQGTGLTATSTQQVVFSAGSITQFALSNPGDMNARTRLGYSALRKDQYGNLVTLGTTTIYLYTSSTSSVHAFYDDALLGNTLSSVVIGSGASNASFWYYEETGGTYTITASDNSTAPDGATGIVDATDTVNVAPVATAFVVYAATSTTVDAGVVVTVKAQKPDGTLDVNYQEDVTLVSSGASTGGGLVAIVNGIGTKTISDTLPENVHLSLSDTESTGLDVTSSADVLFSAGVTAQFAITHVASLSAGERAAYVVTRKDQYGNAVTSASTTVYLFSSSSGANKRFYDASSGGNSITSLVIVPGGSTGAFWYYDETPGSWSITASDNASAPDGAAGILDAADTLVVTAGVTAQFTLTHPGTMTAYTRAGYTLTRKDQFGNLVTSGVGTAYLFSSASGVSTSTLFYDAASGGNVVTSIAWQNGNSQTTFWYEDGTPGTYTITASDNSAAPDGATGIADATDTLIVQSAPIVASRLVVRDPTDTTVDDSTIVTVEAQDSLGNIDTSWAGTVTLLTSGAAIGGGVVTLTSGAGTKTLTDHTAETVTLSLSDTASTGLDVSSTQQVVFASGAVRQFMIDNPGDMSAGSRLGFLLTRKDQYGNPVSSGSTPFYLYTSSTNPNARFFGAPTGGGAITSAMFLVGQSTASVWYYDETSASTTVSVSDNSTAPDGATGITDATREFFVTPAAVAELFLNDPGNMTQGTRLPYTLTRKDAFGNLVRAGIETLYLYTSSATGSAAFYDAGVGGSVTTIAVINDGQSSSNFWYFDDTPGVKIITVSDGTPSPNGATGVIDAADSVTVALAPIVPTKLVIQPVDDVSLGSARTVTVRAEDNSGNVDTTFSGSVTLLTSGTATGGGVMTLINGIGTLSISDTVAETVTLSLLDTGATLLDVSSTRTFQFIESIQPPVSAAVGGSAPDLVLSTPAILGVQFKGATFKGATLNIVPIGGAGTATKREVTAGADGRFTMLFADALPGVRSYGIYATDKKHRITQVKILDAHLADARAFLSVDRILLSPTLGISRAAVTKGDVLYFDGAANGAYTIKVEVDNQPLDISVVADKDGLFSGLLPTSELSFGSHTIRVRQIGPQGEKSDYSTQQVFSVVNIFTPNIDYNRDGSIGISDWSIFVSRWLSKDQIVRSKNDLNGDNKIDVRDFSIFIKTLKI